MIRIPSLLLLRVPIYSKTELISKSLLKLYRIFVLLIDLILNKIYLLLFDDQYTYNRKSLKTRFLLMHSLNYLKIKAGKSSQLNKLHGLNYRKLSLLKALKFDFNEILVELDFSKDFEYFKLEYSEMGGKDNLGFIRFINPSHKNYVGKIIRHNKRFENTELTFYRNILKHFSIIEPHCPSFHSQYISPNGFQILFMEDFGEEIMVNVESIEYLIDAYSKLDQVNFKELKSLDIKIARNAKIKAEDSYFNRNLIRYKLKQISHNLLNYSKNDFTEFISILKVFFLDSRFYENIDSMFDFSLQHGDFTEGTSDGWGNKVVYNGKVLFFDWSNISLTIRGMDIIKLMTSTYSAETIILDFIKNKKYFLFYLKDEIKFILLLEIILNLSLKIKENFSVKTKKDLDFVHTFLADKLCENLSFKDSVT